MKQRFGRSHTCEADIDRESLSKHSIFCTPVESIAVSGDRPGGRVRDGTPVAHRHAAAALLAVVSLTGCGSSSAAGPTWASPAAFARHVDSLYVASTHSGLDRQTFLTYLEYPPAFGALPITIPVYLEGGKRHWSAYVWEVIGPGGADSSLIFVAYGDPGAQMGFFLEQDNAGPGGQIELISDTTVVALNDTDFVIHHEPPSGTCTTAPASDFSNDYLSYAVQWYACKPATFSVDVHATVPGILVGDSAKSASISLSIHEMSGVWLQSH